MHARLNHVRFAQGAALVSAWATLATLASVASAAPHNDFQARPKLWSTSAAETCTSPHACAMARMR